MAVDCLCHSWALRNNYERRRPQIAAKATAFETLSRKGFFEPNSPRVACALLSTQALQLPACARAEKVPSNVHDCPMLHMPIADLPMDQRVPDFLQAKNMAGDAY